VGANHLRQNSNLLAGKAIYFLRALQNQGVGSQKAIDALMCLERYAISKITSASDLKNKRKRN